MRRAPLFPALFVWLGACASGPPPHRELSSPRDAPPPIAELSPCAVAAEQRARVVGLLAEGRLDRTVRVIERADRLCPSSAAASRGALVATLLELGRTDDAARIFGQVAASAAGDAGGAMLEKGLAAPRAAEAQAPTDGRALYFAGRAAAERGQRAEAQRLFDRARVQLEHTTGGVTKLEVSRELWSSVRQATWSKDGRYLAVAAGSFVSIRDTALGLHESMRLEHESEVTWTAFSPDGRTLAAAAAVRGDVRIWDVTTGAELGRLNHTAGARTVRFSPDGRYLGVDLGTIQTWDAETHRKTAELPQYRDGIRVFAFSPDGKTVAAGGYDGALHLANATTGAEIRTLLGHTQLISTVTFSSDGRALISGSFDGTVRLWDVRTGREVRRIAGASGTVGTIDLAPDNRTLAVMTEEDLPDHRDVHHPIRLWDVATGTLSREIANRETGPYASMAFSPDGHRLALAYGRVHVWDTDTGAAPFLPRLQPHDKVPFRPSRAGGLAASRILNECDGVGGRGRLFQWYDQVPLRPQRSCTPLTRARRLQRSDMISLGSTPLQRPLEWSPLPPRTARCASGERRLGGRT